VNFNTPKATNSSKIKCPHKHYDFKNTENYRYITQNYDKEESNHHAYIFISTGLRDDKEQLFKLLSV
jgi:hypothetical protein